MNLKLFRPKGSGCIGELQSAAPQLARLLIAQVELAALEYRSTRLVRSRDATSGKKQVFGSEGSEVVSARSASAHSILVA